jgi:hypothetical protein
MFHLHSLPTENAQRGKRVPDAFGTGVASPPCAAKVAWCRAKWGDATPRNLDATANALVSGPHRRPLIDLELLDSVCFSTPYPACTVLD